MESIYTGSLSLGNVSRIDCSVSSVTVVHIDDICWDESWNDKGVQKVVDEVYSWRIALGLCIGVEAGRYIGFIYRMR